MDRITLHNFFAGTASPQEKELIKNWIKEPGNKEQLIKEREFFNALLFADDEEETEKEREANRPASRYRLHPAWKEVLKIAAVILLVFSAGSLFYNHQMKSIREATHLVSVPPDNGLILLYRMVHRFL